MAAVALAVGVGVAAGAHKLAGSTSIAVGLGLVAAYVAHGELGSRLAPSRARALPQGGPLLMNPAVRRRLIGLLALAGGSFLIVFSLLTGDIDTDAVRDWAVGLGLWGPVLLIGVLALAMVVAPIPNPPFMIAAGLVWGTPLGVTYAVIGQALGSAVIFLTSRYLGRRFIPRLIGERAARRVDELSTSIGPHVVFWWRMMPVTFDFAAYAAGLTAMRFRTFMVLVVLGSILPTTVVVSLGDAIDGSWTVRGITAGIALVAVLAPAAVAWVRYRKHVPQLRGMVRALAAGSASTWGKTMR